MVSPEIKAFADRFNAATNKIAEKINNLLGRSKGLSEADKEALSQIASEAEKLGQNPEEDPNNVVS